MYPQNQKRFGLSTHIVYIVVFDATTGKLVSLMVSCLENLNASITYVSIVDHYTSQFKNHKILKERVLEMFQNSKFDFQ